MHTIVRDCKIKLWIWGSASSDNLKEVEDDWWTKLENKGDTDDDNETREGNKSFYKTAIVLTETLNMILEILLFLLRVDAC